MKVCFGTTYERATNKIPHKVDLIFVGGRRHIGLVQVGRHRRVVGELIEQLPEPFHLLGPFGACFRRQRNRDGVLSKVLARASVRIHCNYSLKWNSVCGLSERCYEDGVGCFHHEILRAVANGSKALMNHGSLG